MVRTAAVGVLSLGAAALLSALAGAPAAQGADAARQAVTADQYERWKTELSNWGRWGKDDEIGTMNLVTPAKRRAAAALVRDGISVSLAGDPDTEKSVDNPEPYEHQMRGIALDRWGVSYHGAAHTHLDALAHVNENGVFFNGYTPDPAAVKQANRHFKNSIHNLKNGVFTRGVLIDLPRLKGVAYLAESTPIYVADIEAWEKRAGVRVGAGDAVFFRTGVWTRRREIGPFVRGRAGKDPGLHPSVIPWLRARDVAIVGSEHPLYLSPSPIPGVTGAAHDFSLVYLGIHLVDNANLDALGDTAAARKRWEFLLTMAPIPIVGGTGSPINPIATF